MLTVWTGPMYAGKTMALSQEIPSFTFKRRGTICITFGEEENERCISRKIDNVVWFCKPGTFSQFLEMIKDQETQHVFIDEAQFASLEDIRIMINLHREGLHIYIACLDQDFTGSAFYSTSILLCAATKVIKLTAMCAHKADDRPYEIADPFQGCITPATMTLKITGSHQVIEQESESVTYSPRCLAHWMCMHSKAHEVG